MATLHWRKYQALRDEVYLLTRAAIPLSAEMYTEPVDIAITAYSKRPMDSDNIAAKLYIDALRALVIEDDGPRFVHNVTLRSRRGNPRVEIIIRGCADDNHRYDTGGGLECG